MSSKLLSSVSKQVFRVHPSSIHDALRKTPVKTEPVQLNVKQGTSRASGTMYNVEVPTRHGVELHTITLYSGETEKRIPVDGGDVVLSRNSAGVVAVLLPVAQPTADPQPTTSEPTDPQPTAPKNVKQEFIDRVSNETTVLHEPLTVIGDMSGEMSFVRFSTSVDKRTKLCVQVAKKELINSKEPELGVLNILKIIFPYRLVIRNDGHVVRLLAHTYKPRGWFKRWVPGTAYLQTRFETWTAILLTDSRRPISSVKGVTGIFDSNENPMYPTSDMSNEGNETPVGNGLVIGNNGARGVFVQDDGGRFELPQYTQCIKFGNKLMFLRQIGPKVTYIVVPENTSAEVVHRDMKKPKVIDYGVYSVIVCIDPRNNGVMTLICEKGAVVTVKLV